jgi:hypothetical protein
MQVYGGWKVSVWRWLQVSQLSRQERRREEELLLVACGSDSWQWQ